MTIPGKAAFWHLMANPAEEKIGKLGSPPAMLQGIWGQKNQTKPQRDCR